MKKSLFILLFFTLMVSVTACVSDSLNAPCPNFGASCKKIPVNSWDYLK